MFYDWVKCYQDFDFELPLVSDRAYQNIIVESGELGQVVQPRFKHEGSFCSSISIQISGNRITIDGNPSKFNRLDNLLGLSSLDSCMKVYNEILTALGLPNFTKCTEVFYRQGQDGQRVETFSDGVTFQRIDITSNYSTGGHSKDYIKGVSTQRYRNSIPRLHTNGFCVDWLSASGNATLMYPKLYDKANEMKLHSLKKIKNKFGKESQEFEYITKLINYLNCLGVVRYEQELHSAFLRKNDFRWWGLFDESCFRTIHENFVNIDRNLKVTAMELENISEQLITEGICNGTRSANTTAMYALQWAHGMTFDVELTQVRTHRARLRKIGIDIKDVFDNSRFSPIVVKRAKEIEVSPLIIPSWYQHAGSNHNQLSLVA